ncbi:MAG: GIY-YIG nuclease family protein [Candidatus Levyibacteriota bacterium]
MPKELQKGSGAWFVYILLCDNNALYTGSSNDPERRFKEHQSGQGAKYTKLYKPLRILYTEAAGNRGTALKRELEIKSWTRKRKIKDLGLRLD